MAESEVRYFSGFADYDISAGSFVCKKNPDKTSSARDLNGNPADFTTRVLLEVPNESASFLQQFCK